MISEACIVSAIVAVYSYQRIILGDLKDASFIACAYLLLAFLSVTLLTKGITAFFALGTYLFLLAMAGAGALIAMGKWVDFVDVVIQYKGFILLFSMCVIGMRLADCSTPYSRIQWQIIDMASKITSNPKRALTDVRVVGLSPNQPKAVRAWFWDIFGWFNENLDYWNTLKHELLSDMRLSTSVPPASGMVLLQLKRSTKKLSSRELHEKGYVLYDENKDEQLRVEWTVQM